MEHYKVVNGVPVQIGKSILIKNTDTNYWTIASNLISVYNGSNVLFNDNVAIVTLVFKSLGAVAPWTTVLSVSFPFTPDYLSNLSSSGAYAVMFDAYGGNGRRFDGSVDQTNNKLVISIGAARLPSDQIDYTGQIIIPY